MIYPKRLKKEIKRLACVAHENEMRHYLELLNQKFSDWKKGKLDTGDLVQQIHVFHHNQARDLYNAYQRLDPDAFLIRAIAAGHLMGSELPEEIKEDVCRQAEPLKGNM